MPRKRWVAPIFGALAVMFSLAALGCGGGESEISKAEFIKKANAICAKAEKQINDGFGKFIAGFNGREPQGAALTAAQAKLVATVMVPAKRQEVEEFREIGAPAKDEDRVEAMADALENGTEEAISNPEEAVTGTVQSFVKLEKLADRYGLEGC